MGKLREGAPSFDPWMPNAGETMQEKIDRHIKEVKNKDLHEVAKGRKPPILESEGSTPLNSEDFEIIPTKNNKTKN